MATMKMSGCLALVAKMPEADQDALLARVDQYQADGIPAERAQVMAANDVLAEIRAERSQLMSAIAEQHPDLLTVSEAPAAQLSRRRNALGLYSALTASVEDIKTNTAPAAGWRDAIKGLVNKGQVKADEVEWSGVNDWLALQQGKVTREQVADYLKQGGVQVEETVLDEGTRLPEYGVVENGNLYDVTENGQVVADGFTSYGDAEDWISEGAASRAQAAGPAKYGQYTLPGGENYREVLLTLPMATSPESAAWIKAWGEKKGLTPKLARLAVLDHFKLPDGDGPLSRSEEIEFSSLNRGFQSSHWDQTNVLAHIRVNDRTDADGNKVLFVEEIQSDWGQEGKKKGFGGKDEPRPTPVTNIPDYWNIKPRTVQVKAQRELFEQEKSRIIRILKEKGLAGSQQAAERWLGADGLAQYKRDSALVGDFFNQTGGAVDRPLSGDPEVAFDRMVATMRSAVPDAFDGFSLKSRKEFGVYNETGALVARGSTEDAARREAMRMLDEQAMRAWKARRREVIPPAPFVTKTEGWLNLALKRVLAMAAEGGYDKVAFVNGEQSADRYDLSKQIDKVVLVQDSILIASKDGQEVFRKEGVKPEDLPDYIGKDPAEKLLAAPEKKNLSGTPTRTITGLDLKVGGEGMKTFYDTIVPTALKKLLPKVGGGQMGQVNLDRSDGYRIEDDGRSFIVYDPQGNVERRVASQRTAEQVVQEVAGGTQQPGFDITDAMREKVGEGLPMFSRQRGSAAEAFDQAEIENLRTPAFKGREKLVEMRIDDFLALAEKGLAKTKLADTSKLLNQGTKYSSLPFFLVDSNYRVDGHEGRHRALALKEAGYETMPVILRMARVRWSEQADPKRFDYREQWPTSLRAQEGAPDPNYSIPFPVSREQAMEPYSPDITASRQRIVGESKRAYTPEQLQYFENVGRTVTTPTLKERIAELRKDLGKKMAQGMADQFRPISDLGQKAYALARLSRGSSGAFEALLHHGKLSLKDGVYDADQSGGFIERVGVPLQGELEDFLWWVAANRAERLTAEDRERLFTAQDIAAGKSLDQGTADFDYVLQHGPRGGQTTRDRTLIFRDALKTFDEFNKNTLDMAEQSGLIDGASRKIWEHEFYVPFYRVAEEGNDGFSGAAIKNSLVRQEAFKKLKGGKEKLNSDLLANTLANWGHLIDAASKNRAAKETLVAAANLGAAVEADEATIKSMAAAAGKKNQRTWFMDGGVKRHFLIEDQAVVTALTSLDYAGLRGPLWDALTAPKHWLTIGVTASPHFKIKNLIRDSVQAIATSELSYNPVKNIAEGVRASDRNSQTYVSALASGGLIRFGTMLEGSTSKRTRQLINMGVKDATILNSDNKVQAMYDKFLEPMVMAYNEIGNRGEEINRASLFKQLTDQGVDQAQAALMARDLMDFSMQGSWTWVRVLTQVVPFLNARIQGMYKLGRSAVDDPKRFGIVLGAVAAASVSLLLAYEDDDDWKKREDWDRDTYWWFKVGGTAFRIPKPFEIGAIGTLAERGLEYFMSPEMTNKRFRKVVSGLMLDQLSMNPVPQVFKPLLDLYSNKDSFTGRPIETMGMEKVKPQYRFTDRTSMLARGLSTGTFGALSPVQYDHIVRGYFAWLGSMVVSATDVVLRPLTGQGERATPDYWKLATGGLVSDTTSASSRYVSQMYEQAKELEQAMGTYRMLMKTGRLEEGREFFKDNKQDIVKSAAVDRVKAAESRYNEMIRMIERSKLDPDVKRDRIQAVQVQKDKIARLVAPGYAR